MVQWRLILKSFAVTIPVPKYSWISLNVSSQIPSLQTHFAHQSHGWILSTGIYIHKIQVSLPHRYIFFFKKNTKKKRTRAWVSSSHSPMKGLWRGIRNRCVMISRYVEFCQDTKTGTHTFINRDSGQARHRARRQKWQDRKQHREDRGTMTLPVKPCIYAAPGLHTSFSCEFKTISVYMSYSDLF